MKIDMSKVNLTERDIEDWLYENPQIIYNRVYPSGFLIDRWLGRQYRLPSGIADLIGVTIDLRPVVIEVKNVPINKAAVLQVCRYALDIRSIFKYQNVFSELEPIRILIGPSIDDQTEHEAFACDVEYLQFDFQLNMTLGKKLERLDTGINYWDQIGEVSKRPEWIMFDQAKVDGFTEKDKYDELMDAISDEQDAPDGNE